MIFSGEPLLGKVDNGSFLIWGKVGEVDPPQLVMPITIEPTKPRMCHDERFFNPWIKDYPIRLDCITDLSLCGFYGHFQTTFDEKSGFDLVRLHPSWSTFSGFWWAGWYLYMPRYLSTGRPTHIFTIASGWGQLISFVYMAFHVRII